MTDGFAILIVVVSFILVSFTLLAIVQAVYKCAALVDTWWQRRVEEAEDGIAERRVGND